MFKLFGNELFVNEFTIVLFDSSSRKRGMDFLRFSEMASKFTVVWAIMLSKDKFLATMSISDEFHAEVPISSLWNFQ